MAKLKDICDVDWGNTSLTKSAYIDDGEYLGVSAAGCDGRMDYYDFDAYTPVISAIGANCGKLFLPEEPFVAIKNTITLKPHDGLDGKYLYYALVNNRIPKRGGGQPFIGKGDTEEYEITVPDIGTQLEIVKRVEKICKIISYREREIDKLDELIKARFVEMFSDEKNMMKMSDICSIITDGTHQPPKFVTKGIPFIFVSNVVSNKITYDAEKFITQETYDELIKRTPIEMGDVLLSTVGSYGHPAVVKSDEKFLFQRHIAYLKPKKDIINSDYLHGALLSPDAQKQIEEGVKGIAQKTLNLSEIKKMTIPVPNLAKQKQFADFEEQVDKSKVAVQKALNETQTLFDSLMQEFFG